MSQHGAAASTQEQVLRQRIKELEEELSKTTALVEDTKTSLRRHEAGDRMQHCADHVGRKMIQWVCTKHIALLFTEC